jgi:predicted Zn finger-like uncharacterized protein
MQLICPSCDRQFVVDAQKIGSGGRKVRCGQCSHEWRAAADDENAADVEGPESDEQAAGGEAVAAEAVAEEDLSADPTAQLAAFDEARRRSRAERKPRMAGARRGAGTTGFKRRNGAVGWLIFVAVAAGLAATLVFARQQLVALVPGAANLYALVGLPLTAQPSGRVLKLVDLSSVLRRVDGERRLVISGTIVNPTEEAQPVPPLVATIADPDGGELERWTFEAGVDMLPPGGSTTFETMTADAPKQGDLNLNFASVEP